MKKENISNSGTNINVDQFYDDYMAVVLSYESEQHIPFPEKYSNYGMCEKTRLCIKNMVSLSCIIIVKAILNKLQLPFKKVELLNVEIEGVLSEIKREQLKSALILVGFELMEDKRGAIVEEIKSTIIEMIQNGAQSPKVKFSVYLSQKLNHNYIYLSNLFSKAKGITIEYFIQCCKIDRAKQLLVYNELTVSEIAWQLQYSSVAHLSNQFKKITGVTPTHFKNMNGKGLLLQDNL